MSRIGNKPVPVAAGVKVSVENGKFKAEGPKGVLTFELRPEVQVTVNDQEVVVTRNRDDRIGRCFQGTTRALINNMILGVKSGYEKKLELQGVGYVCNISNNVLNLRVGLANELKVPIPQDIQAVCPDQTHIHVTGIDKQKVGEFAARVRSLRKPEPYKGKGIRYVGEQVKIKPGKSAKS
jgi:large subunit ribosomal protein L6